MVTLPSTCSTIAVQFFHQKIAQSLGGWPDNSATIRGEVAQLSVEGTKQTEQVQVKLSTYCSVV